jgi:hypothetical protein
VEENKGCFDRRFRSSGEEAAYMQIFHGERLNCRKNAIGTVIQIIGMIMPLEACSAWLDVLMWISQVRSDWKYVSMLLLLLLLLMVMMMMMMMMVLVMMMMLMTVVVVKMSPGTICAMPSQTVSALYHSAPFCQLVHIIPFFCCSRM